MRTKTFGSKKFTVERPGFYLSFSKTIGIYRVMQGTEAEQWEAYQDEETSDEPMDNGEMIAYAQTLGETVQQLFDDGYL